MASRIVTVLGVVCLSLVTITLGAAPAHAEVWSWSCTCGALCDGTLLTTTVNVCADEADIGEAVAEGARSCVAQIDGQCQDHGICECSCAPISPGC